MVSQTERTTMSGEELEEWKCLVSSGKRAVKGLETNQWRLGDLAVEASSNRHYGQHSVEVFAEEISLEYNTLRAYATVSRAYQIDTRVSNLSWSHHREIADREDRLEWLDKAKRENWSILAMKRAIKESETPQPSADVTAPTKPTGTDTDKQPAPDNEPLPFEDAGREWTIPESLGEGPIHEMTPEGEHCRAHDVLVTALGLLMEFRQEFQLDQLCEHILESEEINRDLSTVMKWLFQVKQTLIAAGQPGEAGDGAIPAEHTASASESA